ncbi:MAG: GNAT family N-acetyltransferase [Acidimicrobiia bacterium]|nr:GNAT family N-acetyltransferase [Acidimicrobiia bacterium]
MTVIAESQPAPWEHVAMAAVEYRLGFPESVREEAAALYDEAFAAKLRPGMRDDVARRQVLAEGLDPSRCIAALDDGALLGIAGFHDAGGSLTGGITVRSVVRAVGVLRAVKAIAVFALLERKPKPDELLMDGIVVRADARGRGIGTGLFAELEAYARAHGRRRIRLDVVDTNPGARRLYERLGFVATETERTPYLERFMGFSASTTMLKVLD